MIWRALDIEGHVALVSHYMDASGFSEVQAHVLAEGAAGDPLMAVIGYADRDSAASRADRPDINLVIAGRR